MNIKLLIEYEGTRYYGWQKQKDLPTIQEVLEKEISKITAEKIILYGSGRTDSGVHALGQVANFHTRCTTLSVSRIPKILNSLLPLDIRIKKAEGVEEKFHSRYSALSKIYHYYVWNNYQGSSYVPIFLRNYVYVIHRKVNLEKIKEAASFLLGEHDFTSFANNNYTIQNPIRRILEISVFKKGEFICFHIEANSFLYKMVRTIVGTLLDIGYGKLDPSDLERILQAKNRKLAGKVVPAKGLFLMRVNY